MPIMCCNHHTDIECDEDSFEEERSLDQRLEEAEEMMGAFGDGEDSADDLATSLDFDNRKGTAGWMEKWMDHGLSTKWPSRTYTIIPPRRRRCRICRKILNSWNCRSICYTCKWDGPPEVKHIPEALRTKALKALAAEENDRKSEKLRLLENDIQKWMDSERDSRKPVFKRISHVPEADPLPKLKPKPSPYRSRTFEAVASGNRIILRLLTGLRRWEVFAYAFDDTASAARSYRESPGKYVVQPITRNGEPGTSTVVGSPEEAFALISQLITVQSCANLESAQS